MTNEIKEQNQIHRDVIKPIERLDLDELVIDEFRAKTKYHGDVKSTNDWVHFWDAISDGRRYASIPDYLQSVKQLQKKDQRKVRKLLKSLRSDFEFCLLLSTKATYNVDLDYDELDKYGLLYAYINHNYGLINKQSMIEMPRYDGVFLDEVKNDKDFKNFMVGLSEIDNINEIISLLQYLADRPIANIRLWTPDENKRREHINTGTGFRFYYGKDGNFCIDYADLNYTEGHSRGVRSITGNYLKNKNGK